MFLLCSQKLKNTVLIAPNPPHLRCVIIILSGKSVSLDWLWVIQRKNETFHLPWSLIANNDGCAKVKKWLYKSVTSHLSRERLTERKLAFDRVLEATYHYLILYLLRMHLHNLYKSKYKRNVKTAGERLNIMLDLVQSERRQQEKRRISSIY